MASWREISRTAAWSSAIAVPLRLTSANGRPWPSVLRATAASLGDKDADEDDSSDDEPGATLDAELDRATSIRACWSVMVFPEPLLNDRKSHS